ncbi:MAG: altronate dehydratase family protein [Candidatus Protistobacter heckmanni]|nr:altronate dehydratase family protein [Candidatus Protistobacter heckmanni]
MDLYIRLHPADDVVIARAQLLSGALAVRSMIPPGHKIAARDLPAGAPVRRYNQIIGFATAPIAAGSHVHLHNLGVGGEGGKFECDYAFCADARPTDYAPSPRTFQGIVRADGSIATRNYLCVLTSVNCSATVARAIADHFRRDVHPEALAGFPNIDGEGMAVLRRTLAGYARHANFAGMLMVGLGCDANQIGDLLEDQGLAETSRFKTFNIQDSGGTVQTVACGVAMLTGMLEEANEARRTEVPASALTVGLQCGGSDGYSGISANPALGAAVELLVRHGGTAILSETPEIYGAEHLLTRRARSPEVVEKLVAHIRWWEDYCARNRGEMNNNPSAGNKAGGLTTILEKSLGAVAKGGTMRLEDVYEYAQPVNSKGFVYMDTPGYDPVSATGQVAGGANLICFTTGRGSAYGCAPSPSIKLSTNTALWQHQEPDIDINCGGIVDGAASIQHMGEKTKSERHGYGQSEFVPWQIRAVM